jgi:Secretion system C-terminal sorting domain
MHTTRLFLFISLFTLALNAEAQRYLAPIFPASQITRTTTVYGQNFTILPYAQGGRAARQPLATTIYAASGDNVTNRPLIIYFHTGNFLPFGSNGSCGGQMVDSSNVEMATRLARMGYVVAVTTYRQFWNPLDPQEETRRFLLINAAYRGVQDARTAIRFFKRSVKERSNLYGIDSTKIVLWGQGTGGYVSMAAAYLNTYNEILTTSDPNKFQLRISATTRVPMVRENYNGNVLGTTGPHIVDAAYNAYTRFPIGDTLAVPNHVGYTSNFQLCVNMGGALGDSTWMDPGETPLISYHVPSDGFAPCRTDVLNVGTTTGPQPVVEVSGSCDLAVYADRYNLNRKFATIPASLPDPFGATARARSGGRTGFYPFIGTPANSGSPWEWTAAVPPAVPTGCNANARSARLYIDTIIGYFAPRAFLELGLGTIGTREEILEVNSLSVAPNPATDAMTFSADIDFKGIDIFDLSGRLVRTIANVNTNQYVMQRQGIPNGLYVARIRFDKGIATRKVLFE